MQTRRYFLFILLISCGLLAAFSFTLYRQSRLNDNFNNLAIHSYEVLRQARLVMTSALDMETGARGYLLTKQQTYLEPYRIGVDRIHQEVVQLQKLVADNPAQTTLARNISEHIDGLIAVLEKHVARAADFAEPVLQTDETMSEEKQAMDVVRATMTQFIEEERRLLQSRSEVSRSEQRQYLMLIVIGTALALGGIFLANFIIMGLSRRAARTEGALRHLEDGYRMILDSVNDGIYDYNTLTGELLFSPSYARMLGYEIHELAPIIETFNQLLHPDDYEPVWVLMRQFMEREVENFATTYRLRHKNGSWRWVLSRAVGLWSDSGKVQRIVGIHTDITQQKEREEELHQLNQDLESFVYITSHDLRAPLVNMRGFAGEIAHSLKEVDEVAARAKLEDANDRERLKTALEMDIPESLRFIRAAVEKMDLLTNAILELSRIGRREFMVKEVDAEALVQRILDSMNYEISEKNVRVKVDTLPTVQTDPIALEQIFSNIIDNAVKYLDPNRPGEIHIYARTLAWEVEFIVEDNGRGIAESDRRRVFDIFRRASNSGSVRGIGMGMASVKAVLRKLGGRIWFESSLGEGSEFHFTLAVPQERTATQTHSATRKEAA